MRGQPQSWPRRRGRSAGRGCPCCPTPPPSSPPHPWNRWLGYSLGTIWYFEETGDWWTVGQSPCLQSVVSRVCVLCRASALIGGRRANTCDTGQFSSPYPTQHSCLGGKGGEMASSFLRGIKSLAMNIFWHLTLRLLSELGTTVCNRQSCFLRKSSHLMFIHESTFYSSPFTLSGKHSCTGKKGFLIVTQ